jgi:hypothetical protein
MRMGGIGGMLNLKSSPLQPKALADLAAVVAVKVWVDPLRDMSSFTWRPTGVS